MSRRRPAVALAMLAAASLGISHARAGTNIILNGGFETPDPTAGPTVAQYWNQGGTNVTRDTTNPHTGVAEEYLNNTAPASALSLFQDTPSGTVTPGSTYTLDFFYSGATLAGGELQSRIVYFSQNMGPTLYTPFNYLLPNSTTYSEATYAIPAAPANTSYAEVQFFAVTGGATGSVAQVYLDDVSLTGVGGGGGGGNNGSGVSVWNVSGAGDWNISTNWTNGVPSGIGAEADLFTALTASHTIYSDIPITLGTLNFNNTNTYVVAGAGSLTMQASNGSAAVIVQQGTQKINLPLIIASNLGFNVASGSTLLVSDPVTINAGINVTSVGTVTYQSTVTLGTGASLALSSSNYLHSLTLAANASTSVMSSANRLLLQTDSLSLASGSDLNLNNNDLIVHGGSLATYNSLVKSGYNGGNWQGSGISSTTAGGDSRHLTALGVISNDNGRGGALYGTGTTMGLFDGTSPAVGDVLVRYTYYGDANVDGKVDASDYSRIDNGYLQQLSGWANGDFNYDGVVNGSDYTLIDNAFNTQGAPIGAASAQLAQNTAQIAGSSAVPEPGSLAIISAAWVGLLHRRRPRTNR